MIQYSIVEDSVVHCSIVPYGTKDRIGEERVLYKRRTAWYGIKDYRIESGRPNPNPLEDRTLQVWPDQNLSRIDHVI